jgi:8-oxo-dGTP pyrophosphatase MutT (NUDIX family)
MIVTTDLSLLKAHVKAHTKKDGTVVKDYERKQGSLFSNKHFTGGKPQKIVAPQYGGSLFASPVKQKPKPKMVHPKLGEDGKLVGIYDPHHPSEQSTWHAPTKTATFVPGGACPKTLNGLALSPWHDHPTTDEGWDYVDGLMEDLDEPDMHVKEGLQIGSGCIIQEPDGRVWMVSPTNKFGGYANTFPKGKIDDGLSWQANAVKETYEESGLQVEIVGFLGDYERSTSVTRYYLAKRVGGTPSDVGWESQAVHLVPPDELMKMAHNPADKPVVGALIERIKKNPV